MNVQSPSIQDSNRNKDLIQEDGKEKQHSDNDQHEDGEGALDDPALESHSLVAQEIGIHIAESVEDSHNTAGAKHQAEQDADGEQSLVRLVHDIVNGVGHIIQSS